MQPGLSMMQPGLSMMQPGPSSASCLPLCSAQIYNLMRLDSYQRFKRSDVVQKCLVAEMDGRPLPVTLPQEESEERDKVNPLPAVRIEDKSDGGAKPAKEATSKGWGLFSTSKRSNSFRNNPKTNRSGVYLTNEGKKKSKTVRDKTRGAATTRVEPEPEEAAVRSGFQIQDEEDVDVSVTQLQELNWGEIQEGGDLWGGTFAALLVFFSAHGLSSTVAPPSSMVTTPAPLCTSS